MRANERYDENGWLKDEFLWPLRQQICLGSLFISDYENSFGIDPHKVCDFFTNFWDTYCEELAEQDHVREKAIAAAEQWNKEKREPAKNDDDFYLEISAQLYDNEKTLIEFYRTFDCESGNPLPLRLVNVDIHYDFARSIQVLAKDEDEAYDIVDEMMRKGEIPLSTFETTDDWELDTSYQPEEE